MDKVEKPILSRMIKSKGIRRAGHPARIGRRVINIANLWKSQKKSGQQQDSEVGGRITLRCILQKQDWW
jgi:hypothetical protein